jgi:hypothetical protein
VNDSGTAIKSGNAYHLHQIVDRKGETIAIAKNSQISRMTPIIDDGMRIRIAGEGGRTSNDADLINRSCCAAASA